MEKELKDVQMNIRLKPEVAERFKALCKDLGFVTQSVAINQMLNVCETSELLKTGFGKTMEQDTKDFMMHLSALTTIFNASIQRGEDVKAVLENDFEQKYAGKNTLIEKLKQELEEAKRNQAVLERRIDETVQAEKAAWAAQKSAEEVAEGARKSEAAWKQNVDTLSKQIEMLTSQLEQAKENVASARKVEEKCKRLEAELAQAKGTITGLQAVIEKYMK